MVNLYHKHLFLSWRNPPFVPYFLYLCTSRLTRTRTKASCNTPWEKALAFILFSYFSTFSSCWGRYGPAGTLAMRRRIPNPRWTTLLQGERLKALSRGHASFSFGSGLNQRFKKEKSCYVHGCLTFTLRKLRIFLLWQVTLRTRWGTGRVRLSEEKTCSGIREAVV